MMNRSPILFRQITYELQERNDVAQALQDSRQTLLFRDKMLRNKLSWKCDLDLGYDIQVINYEIRGRSEFQAL
jgi:hypothetical protein